MPVIKGYNADAAKEAIGMLTLDGNRMAGSSFVDSRQAESLGTRQQTIALDGSSALRLDDIVRFPKESDWRDCVFAIRPNKNARRIALAVMAQVESQGEIKYLPVYLGTLKRRVALLTDPDNEESLDTGALTDDAACDWAGKGILDKAVDLCGKVQRYRGNDYDALRICCGVTAKVTRHDQQKVLTFPPAGLDLSKTPNKNGRVRGTQTVIDLTIIPDGEVKPAEGKPAEDGAKPKAPKGDDLK